MGDLIGYRLNLAGLEFAAVGGDDDLLLQRRPMVPNGPSMGLSMIDNAEMGDDNTILGPVPHKIGSRNTIVADADANGKCDPQQRWYRNRLRRPRG